MMYLLPIVLIVASVAYTLYMKKKVSKMSPEEMAESFHQHNSVHFEMQPGEKVIGFWSGLEYQEKDKGLGAAAGAAAKAAAGAVVGISSYIPQVHVGLSSTGRILVAREYSEMLQRGSFKQILALPGGRPQTGTTSMSGGAVGKPPKNPFNPMAKLEFVRLVAPTGESYEAWLSEQGVRVGQAGFHSIVAS